MIIDSFDMESESKINSCLREDAPTVDACIITFSYIMIRESKGYLYFILLAIGTLKTEYVAVNFQKC